MALTRQHMRSCDLVVVPHHEHEEAQDEHADEATIRARIAALSNEELVAYVAPSVHPAALLDSVD